MENTGLDRPAADDGEHLVYNSASGLTVDFEHERATGKQASAIAGALVDYPGHDLHARPDAIGYASRDRGHHLGMRRLTPRQRARRGDLPGDHTRNTRSCIDMRCAARRRRSEPDENESTEFY